jgi:hypothetical protein
LVGRDFRISDEGSVTKLGTGRAWALPKASTVTEVSRIFLMFNLMIPDFFTF